VAAVIESKDESQLSPEQLATTEVNVGVYAFDRDALFAALAKLTPDAATGEIFLPAVIEHLTLSGGVFAQLVDDPLVAQSANTPEELAELDARARQYLFAAAIEAVKGNVLEARISYQSNPTYDQGIHLSNCCLQLDYLQGKSWATRYAPLVARDGSLSFESWQATDEVYQLERQADYARAAARQCELDHTLALAQELERRVDSLNIRASSSHASSDNAA
jgi:hypothetical protein